MNFICFWYTRIEINQCFAHSTLFVFSIVSNTYVTACQQANTYTLTSLCYSRNIAISLPVYTENCQSRIIFHTVWSGGRALHLRYSFLFYCSIFYFILIQSKWKNKYDTKKMKKSLIQTSNLLKNHENVSMQLVKRST